MASRIIYEVLPLVREYLREDAGIIIPDKPVDPSPARIELTEEGLGDLEELRLGLEKYFGA